MCSRTDRPTVLISGDLQILFRRTHFNCKCFLANSFIRARRHLESTARCTTTPEQCRKFKKGVSDLKSEASQGLLISNAKPLMRNFVTYDPFHKFVLTRRYDMTNNHFYLASKECLYQRRKDGGLRFSSINSHLKKEAFPNDATICWCIAARETILSIVLTQWCTLSVWWKQTRFDGVNGD